MRVMQEPGEAILRVGKRSPTNPCRRVDKVHSGKGAESIQCANSKAHTGALDTKQGVHIFRPPLASMNRIKEGLTHKTIHLSDPLQIIAFQIYHRILGKILLNLPCFNVKVNIRKICSRVFLKIYRIIEKNILYIYILYHIIYISYILYIGKHNRTLARLLC